jgi:hypothetical protein
MTMTMKALHALNLPATKTVKDDFAKHNRLARIRRAPTWAEYHEVQPRRSCRSAAPAPASRGASTRSGVIGELSVVVIPMSGSPRTVPARACQKQEIWLYHEGRVIGGTAMPKSQEDIIRAMQEPPKGQ